MNQVIRLFSLGVLGWKFLLLASACVQEQRAYVGCSTGCSFGHPLGVLEHIPIGEGVGGAPLESNIHAFILALIKTPQPPVYLPSMGDKKRMSLDHYFIFI